MITISSRISRSDDESLARKIPDVNKFLKQFFKQKTWPGFIDHSNISATGHLNWSLHLNKVEPRVFLRILLITYG